MDRGARLIGCCVDCELHGLDARSQQLHASTLATIDKRFWNLEAHKSSSLAPRLRQRISLLVAVGAKTEYRAPPEIWLMIFGFLRSRDFFTAKSTTSNVAEAARLDLIVRQTLASIDDSSSERLSDYYSLLKVGRFSSTAQITAAYQARMLEVSAPPNENVQVKLMRPIKEITAAYQVLVCRNQRTLYDCLGRARFAQLFSGSPVELQFGNAGCTPLAHCFPTTTTTCSVCDQDRCLACSSTKNCADCGRTICQSCEALKFCGNKRPAALRPNRGPTGLRVMGFSPPWPSCA